MAHSFRTEINCSPGQSIELQHKILTLGSCFADQFGSWLQTNKFQVLTNPFGTVYNPISIHTLLTSALDLTLEQELFLERDGYWFHHHYHSLFTDRTKESLGVKINQQQQKVKEFLYQTDVVILTYGTAWVYQLKSNQKRVSNCHKVPGSSFEKKLLSVDEIVDSFQRLVLKVRAIKPTVRILLTVSPVRHLKDTLELNSVSKSVLRLACHHLRQPGVEYFPAYELLLDDLRDYRFYDRDMIHPSAEARDYINNKFSDRYFSEATKKLIGMLNEVHRALAHKPFQLASPIHQQFLVETLKKLELINVHLPVQTEIDQIQSLLNTHA